jgi:hypothetical protein
MKSEDYKRKVDTRDVFLARSADFAGRIRKREKQLKGTAPDLCTRVAKCTEVDDGIFELLWWTVTSISFLYNRFVIQTLN